MSNLIVKVTTIDEIKPHNNADALEIAIVGGWQCVVKKGEYQTGAKIVYFPPDTVIPVEVSDRFGVTNYLSNGRIRCAKLRGEPSFGLVVPPDGDWPLGFNVADHYGATKYEPPIKANQGDVEADDARFEKYIEVENLRNYVEMFTAGEQVCISEKIHGTNCRVGIVDGQRMAGSRKLRRKEPEDYRSNVYWFPWTIPAIENLLTSLSMEHKSVVLYGEVFGKGVQNLQYGRKGLDFLAFDLFLDGKYLGYHHFVATCNTFGVHRVPDLGVHPFDLGVVATLSRGHTLAGGDHIREGVVVRPVVERNHHALGRVIMKYVNSDYLLKQTEDFTDL